MEYLPIQALAQRAGVSGNTVIRYLKMFEEFFTDIKDDGGVKKYSVDTIALIKKIHELSNNKTLSKEEIKEMLQLDFPLESNDFLSQPTESDTVTIIGSKIDKLTQSIDVLNQYRLDKLINAIESLNETLSIIPALLGNKKPQAEPVEKTVMDQLLTTKPEEADDESGLLDVFEQTEQIFSSENTETSETQEISEKPEASESNPQEESLSLTPVPDPADPDQEGKKDYHDYVIDLILKFKDSGMTLNEIKTEQEKRNLKTFTGLDTWSTGTISNLYSKHSAL